MMDMLLAISFTILTFLSSLGIGGILVILGRRYVKKYMPGKGGGAACPPK
ncbi:MAG: hypothetical protein HYZ25_15585 [Chloroflexi bacterium]|nr:hypothetical protein [Chloroflexota bacterium]